MKENIKRVLVILSNPIDNNDKRANVVNNLAKTFVESCLQVGLEVDVIDLYKDKGFDPVLQIDDKDTKVLEYQIRIRKSQIIAIFHPVWWHFMPAVLKGFVDKVFIPGFAYRQIKRTTQPLLDGKVAFVIAVSDKPIWQLKYIYGNILENFWRKSVFDVCGIKNTIYYFGNLRTIRNEEIEKWHNQIKALVNSKLKSESILDLF